MRRLTTTLSKAFLAALVAVLALGVFPGDAVAQGTATLRFSPQPLAVEVGQTFTVDLWVDDVTGLYGLQAFIDFNPSVLEVRELKVGPLWGGEGVSAPLLTSDNASGQINLVIFLIGAPAVSGSGSLAQITFRAKAVGESDLEFVERVLDVVPMPTELSSPEGLIPSDLNDATVSVYKLTRLEVAPATASLTAGQRVSYTARALDQAGSARVVTGQTTFSIEPGAGGTWLGPTYVGEKAGTWTVTGTYTSPGGSRLVGTASLTVHPGAPEALTLSAASEELAVGQTTVLVATVTDAYGNPVADSTKVSFATNRGTFSNESDRYEAVTQVGVAQAIFKATGPSAAIATITASSGNGVDSVQISIRPSAKPEPGPQPEPGPEAYVTHLPLVMCW